ncbi:methyltransferase-like protein 23 isoform X2 [Silurus meridionalis]|uniref:methyltransferase-like protein 23 isoform X2 n=1 Tax=Silurus meridionalis TaxID=175797 RepID=UPI001EEBAA6F|nr:methyltransferase-like protein 23 isoform X2 [Silurus meridionalis]
MSLHVNYMKCNEDQIVHPGFTENTFTFESHDGTQALTVSVPEVPAAQYGMYVWPCAVVLAQYVWSSKEKIHRQSVLELGAGVSLPGIVAAKCGAHVTLSDSAEIPLCLENSRRCCELNGLPEVPVVGLTWGEISPALCSLPPVDIILGSDVFYDPEDFEDVLVTLSFLLRRNPSGQFWTTFQERRNVRSIAIDLLKTVGVGEVTDYHYILKLLFQLRLDYRILAEQMEPAVH